MILTIKSQYLWKNTKTTVNTNKRTFKPPYQNHPESGERQQKMEIPANENETPSTNVNKAESADRARWGVGISAIGFGPLQSLLRPNPQPGCNGCLNPLGLRLQGGWGFGFSFTFSTSFLSFLPCFTFSYHTHCVTDLGKKSKLSVILWNAEYNHYIIIFRKIPPPYTPERQRKRAHTRRVYTPSKMHSLMNRYTGTLSSAN